MQSRPDVAPRDIYAERLGAREHTREAARRRVARLSNVRLGAFALVVAVVGLALWSPALALAWAALPALAFAWAVALHRRAARDEERSARAVAFYRRAVERIDHTFRGHGRSGEVYQDPDHPYAGQLDLFGAGGLFERIASAQTEAGRDTLARWLLEPADPSVIRARQAAVRELTPRLDLREALFVLGPDLASPMDASGLPEWVAAEPAGASREVRTLLPCFAAANLAAIAAWVGLDAGPLPLLLLAAIELPIALRLRGRVREILRQLDRPCAQLDLAAGVLAALERESFASPRLKELHRDLVPEGVPASRRLRGLIRRVDLLESRRNQMFAPFVPLLLWTTQLAFSIEAWREAHRERLPRWLEAVGELEALLDLAGLAFDHPDHPFPVLLEEGPCFRAEALGHPLIPDARCVRNDVALDRELGLYVISGSNMSGKSTLMRSVGINCVLAFAGGPVRARSLELSPLRLGASLRVVDSLVDGVSHFQAEVLRVRLIVGLAGGDPPLLFLLDEIFQGTNSHDRLHGATAILKGLLERGAIGLVSTHDLALAGIADSLAPRARNVHFSDDLVDGEMVFDYRLRAGVVERSNAVALMRAVGLEV